MSTDVQHIGHAEVSNRSRRVELKPKDRRDRLFRKSKPFIRRLEILDGEQYSKDISILWAAYKAGSFALPMELSQAEFIEQVEKNLSQYSNTWIVDDDAMVFASARGPVAMVSTASSGLIVEPRFVFFEWARPRTILRVVVSFINMIKHSKKTGIILLRVGRENMTMPNHLKFHYIGRSGENEHLYSMRGRGSDGNA